MIVKMEKVNAAIQRALADKTWQSEDPESARIDCEFMVAKLLYAEEAGWDVEWVCDHYMRVLREMKADLVQGQHADS